MRLVFAGTPEAALPSLETLAERHEIVAVLTRPDAPTGRRRVLTPSPVAIRAAELGLPVLKPAKLDADFASTLAALDAELGAIVAYGALLREPVLSIPRLGWINLHFSLLPRWRGAAPVQRAVIAGDSTTGASVFQLEAGLDTGPVFGTLERPIGANETSGHLLGALAVDGAGLLARVADELAAGTAVSVPQEGEPTLAAKLSLADAALDPREDAQRMYARLRGVTPEPGAFLSLAAGERLKLHDAAVAWGEAPVAAGHFVLRDRKVLLGTGTEPLQLLTLQSAGRKAMDAPSWWRGLTDPAAVVAVPPESAP